MNEHTFSTAFSRVTELAEDFAANEHRFLETSYSEAQARLDFIDKFWMALGWDVNHEREKNPYRQEVKVERGVAVSNRLKKADYAFFAAPNFRDVKFYVEAKKPSRNLDNSDDYFQTIRYGWSSKTPLAVLTDFEQFRVIDCRYKPNIKTAENFALKKFSYREYADEEKFREIYYLFSREAVISGSLEEYAANLPKRGRGAKQGRLFAVGVQKSVDESFLDDLDNYREELARSFKNKNAELDGEELTEAVTRTLDRLVFIRFLEDKLIEPDTMMDKFDSWVDFVRASSKLNSFYNGIIFKQHFIDSPDFKPDEKVFTDICGELSSKDSPYYLGDIPVHILGSVYERFLGKVIVATDKRATVQEKPEVRKAGGVYYTPEYIVRYIVENTIGALIENKTPEEIAEMRFADIACGSGSFLLGVYDYLLRYHTAYYNAAGKKGEARAAGCLENGDGSFTLSIAQRREILRNNIYGVDVDAQAVEVAQLSLALKLLEDATTATARAFQPKLGEKILPDMTRNIVCGNSLIDHDIFDGQLFERDEQRKLNPMSYEDKFPEIMRRGGFDAIVGNPPYVRQELLGATVKNYLQRKYKTYHGVADLYVYFFEKYISILKPESEFGIIVANKWLRANYGEPLRRWLKEHFIEEISDFGDLPVFQGATTYPAIVRVKRAKAQATFPAAKITTLDYVSVTINEHIAANMFTVNQIALDNSGWSLTDETSQALLDKLRKVGVSLGEYVEKKIYRGVLTGLNEAFVIDEATKDKLIAEDTNSAELIKPFLLGRDIKRYETPRVQKYLILMPKGWTHDKWIKSVVDKLISEDPQFQKFKDTPEEQSVRNKMTAIAKSREFPPKIAWTWLEQTYSAIAVHLAPFAEAAEKRCDKGEFWWELRACDYYDEFEKPKIVYPNICKRPEFIIDENLLYTNQKCFIISNADKYLLAILNSRVSFFLFRQLLPKLRGDFYEPSYVYFKDFPIRAINLDDAAEKAAHDRMVSLVEQMLDAKKHLQAARTDKDKTFYQDRCNALDRQIDKLVYDLYALTPDEIKIVENKNIS